MLFRYCAPPTYKPSNGGIRKITGHRLFGDVAAWTSDYALAAHAVIVYIVHNVCSDIRFYKQEAS
jgi:hypothetical protein